MCTGCLAYDGDVLLTNIADNVVSASISTFPTQVLFISSTKSEPSLYLTIFVNFSKIHFRHMTKIWHPLIEDILKYTGTFLTGRFC